MFDIGIIVKIKQALSELKARNPQVTEFGSRVISKGFCEGQRISISVTYPDGTEYRTDLTVNKEDLSILNTIGSVKL